MTETNLTATTAQLTAKLLPDHAATVFYKQTKAATKDLILTAQTIVPKQQVSAVTERNSQTKSATMQTKVSAKGKASGLSTAASTVQKS